MRIARWMIVLASLTAIACGGSKEPARGAGSAATGSAAAGPGTTSAEPTKGGYIRLPSTEPRYLNPLLETRFDLANTLMFEGLVGTDAKSEPVPRLAESWTLSPDGLTLTFTLRAGATWHDGARLTSHDVAFTFETLRQLTVPSTWKPYMTTVSELQTPDERTVVVRYASAYAPALAAWTMPILPAHIYRSADIVASPANREAVGSGPFKLVRWEAGQRVVLAAHATWWGGKPYLDGLELVFGISDGDMLESLRAGKLDWAPIRIADDQLNLTQSPALRDEFNQAELVEARLRLIAWNTERAPLDKKEIRQALTLALDRQRVIEDVLSGRAAPLAGPFFPSLFTPDAPVAPLPFDPTRAQALLDAAAPPTAGGRRFDLELLAVESMRSAVTDSAFAIWRRDFDKLGVGLKLTFLPATAYFERIRKRDFDGVLFGWLPDLPDPDPYALLHTSQIGLGANYAGYANAEVDALLDQARSTTDRAARRALYTKVLTIVADEVPYSALFAPYGFYAWTHRLAGVSPRDVGAHPLSPGVARWWLAGARGR